MPQEPTAEQADTAAKVLKLLADPTRLKIVYTLLHGEHSVNELASHIDVQPSAVSQHLAKLRLALLVATRREGNRVFYVIADRHLETLVAEAFLHAGAGSTAKAAPRRRERA